MGITTIFLITAAAPVDAQQQAVQSVPSTQNPQASGSNLFNQDSNVQYSTDVSKLQSNQAISLPSGAPAHAKSSDTQGRSYTIYLIVFIAVLLLAIYVYRIFKRQKTGISTAADNDNQELASVPEEAVSAEPIVPPKKPSTKKKKRRSQSRKKKH